MSTIAPTKIKKTETAITFDSASNVVNVVTGRTKIASEFRILKKEFKIKMRKVRDFYGNYHLYDVYCEGVRYYTIRIGCYDRIWEESQNK